MPQHLVLPTWSSPLQLRTARTLLRQWREDDLPAWIAMNADPEVRRWFTAVLTPEQAYAEASRIRAAIAERGWGPWALELPGSGLPCERFAGFVGLLVHGLPLPFMPAVEIGWRLDRRAWGQGYATEAARAALDFAFETLGLPDVVSITVPGNAASRAVMRRLGLEHDAAADFDHPRIPKGHALERHVLYRIDRAGWLARRPAPSLT
jgi:ribosomal-protein-alanine N-acetyltransferase